MPDAPKKFSYRKPAAGRKRLSSRQRGYGKEWAAFRAAYAETHPAVCDGLLPSGKRCRAALASRDMHLDHKEPVSGPDDPRFFDEDAVHWLCVHCHSRKTARVDGGFGND